MDRNLEHAPAPERQSMTDGLITAPPPPAYTDPSRFFWRNYTKDQSIYCATECCCRICCLPCFCTTCIAAFPCFCVASVLHFITDWSYFRCTIPTEKDLCWCCCGYNYLDKNIPNWAIVTVGCIKFPEMRTENEQKQVDQCIRCLNNCICCPCNTCDWFCGLSCVNVLNVSCKRCLGIGGSSTMLHAPPRMEMRE